MIMDKKKKYNVKNFMLNKAYLIQDGSSHGKPGKIMEFHFYFPGLEKSWKLTPGFGKFIKVM